MTAWLSIGDQVVLVAGFSVVHILAYSGMLYSSVVGLDMLFKDPFTLPVGVACMNRDQSSTIRICDPNDVEEEVLWVVDEVAVGQGLQKSHLCAREPACHGHCSASVV